MTQLSRRIALNLLDRARKGLRPLHHTRRFSYGPPPAIKTRETVGGQIKRATKYTVVVFGMVEARASISLYPSISTGFVTRTSQSLRQIEKWR